MLGARVAFAIEAMGTRVAEVAVSPQGPRLVLADHLAGDAPVLLHRVSDPHGDARAAQRSRVAAGGPTGATAGPLRDLPKPWRPAAWLYQLTRPEVDRSFADRADF